METASVCHAFPPLVAFGKDFPESATHRQDPALQTWLGAASLLWRLGQVENAARGSMLRTAAAVFGDVGEITRAKSEARSPSSLMPTAEPRILLGQVLSTAAEWYEMPSNWSPALGRAVRHGAEYLERQGAFHLAYSLLAGLRQVVDPLSKLEVGRTLALQGRIARQLGAVETADDHYRVAERIGRKIGEPDVYVRALLGRGVIAATRGNYPEARALFRRGLRAAAKSGLSEHIASAHSALLMAAYSAKDLDSALLHGWAAFLHAASLPDRQAEVLINLAGVALLAGYPESALAACREALTLTTIDRILLAGYGTGAIAAARLGRRAIVDTLAAGALSVIEQSHQDFDKAFGFLELAESYVELGATDEALGFLSSARRIAEPARFFELLHRADLATQRLADPSALVRAKRLPSSLAETRAGTSDTDWHDDNVALSTASRRVIRSLAELRS